MPTPLIGPDGREYEVDDDPAAIENALKQGFRVETAEAPRTLGEKASGLSADATEVVNAGLFGLGQGATAGIYGATALSKSEGDSPEEIARKRTVANEAQRLAEEHPIASTVGNIAGMVVSPLSKVSGAVAGSVGAASVAGRIGAGILGGMAEGSLVGAGNAISDSVLGDHQLSGEQLIAGAGLGALLGGAGGGLGTSLGEGASAVAKATKKGLAKLDLGNFAESKALKAAGAAKRDLDYLGEARAKEVGRMLLDDGHLGTGAQAPTARGVHESVQARKLELGSQIGKIADDLEASGVRPDFGKAAKRIDDFEATLSPLQRDAIASDLKATRSALSELEAVGLRAGVADEGKGGFKALDQLKKDLQSKAKYSDAAQSFAGDLKKKLAGTIREEVDAQVVPQLGDELGKKWLAAKKGYGLLKDAERITEHGVEKLGGNASLGLRDVIAGAGMLSSGNPVGALVASIASKAMRERGAGVVAKLADTLTKSPAMSTLATSFAQKAAQAAPMLGEYASTLASAAAKSPQHALATHLVMAQADPNYGDVASLAGFHPQSEAEQGAAVQRAHGIATIAATLAAQNEEIDRAIDKAFKGGASPKDAALVLGRQDFGAKRMRRDGETAYQRRADEIQALATNPEALLDRLSANMGDLHTVAPGVAASVTQTANRAVQYLSQAAQRPLKAGPLAPEWKASDAERHAFAQKLEVVENPMVVLRHAAAGTLNKSQVEALNAVYPTMGRQIADKVLERLAESPKSVPYGQRVMLALLTKTDVDGTLSPKAIAANQAAIQRAADSEPAAAGRNPTKQGAEKLTLGSRMATASQQREVRDEE